MIRLTRLALCGALILLTACSISLSYRAADWWLRWTLDGLVSLDATQERDLDQRLGALLDWHRHSELPRYREWLQTVRGELAQPSPPPAQWQQGSQQLRDFWLAAMQRLQPEATALLAGLSDEQARELVGNLRTQQEETAAEWNDLSADALRAKREKSMVRQLRRWIGRLDSTQRSHVRRWAEQLADNRDERFRQRRQWLDDFEKALARRGEREWFSAELEALMLRPEQRWREPYSAALEHNTQLTLELLRELHLNLGPRQRRALDSHLQTWSDRFERLAAG